MEHRAEIDDLLEDLKEGRFFAPLSRRRKGQGRRISGALPESTWKVPVPDVIEKEDELKLSAGLPGLTEDDIDLRVSDSMLTVRLPVWAQVTGRPPAAGKGEAHACKRDYVGSRTVCPPGGQCG